MPKRLTTTPFVLLDDARASNAAPARLYRDPAEVQVAHRADEIAPLLARLKGERRHVAGYIAYEAGHALEPRLASLAGAPPVPLAWFGVFDGYTEIAPGEVGALLPDAAGGWAGTPKPAIARDQYAAALERVQAYITAGDIYQANLTFPTQVATAGHPLAVYAGLRQRARAGYGGVVWTGADWLLSLSPELFFALHDGKVTTKPMKGTAPRGATPDEDKHLTADLQNDPKQRAENLMIVDLLRNDLSRVAHPGSVEVPHLFTIESYPTVHQMTSTVTAQLRDGLTATDLIGAIFPCGSITGAPKIRAMEIIAEVEAAPRGIYTGSIGRIDPNGDAAFSVAIRTLHLRDGASSGTLGLGSGIVADSRLGPEWDECLAKGKFVGDDRLFDLIETMRFEPEAGIVLLDGHIARLGESARALDFAFDRHAVRNELQLATFMLEEPRRVRLMLAKSGRMAIEIGPLAPTPHGAVDVAIAPMIADPADFRLSHKTSDRSVYGDVRARAGTFEIAFTDADGFLTEGSFTNIFVERDGVLLTPPLSRGLLPGVLRADLLDTGRAVEADLTVADLGQGFLIGNASRGLIPARLV